MPDEATRDELQRVTLEAALEVERALIEQLCLLSPADVVRGTDRLVAALEERWLQITRRQMDDPGRSPLVKAALYRMLNDPAAREGSLANVRKLGLTAIGAMLTGQRRPIAAAAAHHLLTPGEPTAADQPGGKEDKIINIKAGRRNPRKTR